MMVNTKALPKGKLVSLVFRALVFTLGFVTLSANLYVRFYYASAMPRSPQPQTGRVYAIPAQYGGTVYINREEYERRTFIRDDLISIFGVVMLLYVGTEAAIARWINAPKTAASKRP
jgi:hypothetical protein